LHHSAYEWFHRPLIREIGIINTLYDQYLSQRYHRQAAKNTGPFFINQKPHETARVEKAMPRKAQGQSQRQKSGD
jgi:hypothetical protein